MRGTGCVDPLIVLGYGAMTGGTVGAIHGLKLRENLRIAGLPVPAYTEDEGFDVSR